MACRIAPRRIWPAVMPPDAPPGPTQAQQNAATTPPAPSGPVQAPTCRWCGKPLDLQAWMCGECDKPARWQGYAVASAAFMGASLLLPLMLIVATYSLNREQQNIANRQKLAEAYVAFSATMTEFRKAGATLDVLKTVADSGNAALPEVKKAVVELDAAINAIGGKLGPFEEAARRPPINKASPAAELSDTWTNCFVWPYYGSDGVPQKNTYWVKIQTALKSCTDNKCPSKAISQITSLIHEIWSGTCLCHRPEPQRSMNWFYPVLQGMMGGRDNSQPILPSQGLAPPNPDLDPAKNAVCKPSVKAPVSKPTPP